MPVKTFQVRSDNPNNHWKYPHELMLALYLFGYLICCSFMFVNKRTVLNENCVRVHVRWTEKSGNQI